MATNLDDMTARSREGWNGFSWFIGLACVGVVVTLGLMALFLL